MDGYLISTDGGLDMDVSRDELLNRTIYPYEEEVIPSVGRTVFVIHGKQICEEKVYALGSKTFILEGFRSYVDSFGELRYSDYYNRWFYELDDAKRHLSKYLTDDEIIEEDGFTGVWNAVKL